MTGSVLEGVERNMMRGLDYGYGMMGGGWIAGLVMSFFGLLVIIGIVLIVVWIVRSSSGHHQASGGSASQASAAHDEAVAIAKRRYANGEIDRAQYEEIMRGLGG